MGKWQIYNGVTGEILRLRNNKHKQWGDSVKSDEDYIEPVEFSRPTEAFDCIYNELQSTGTIFLIKQENEPTITVLL